MKRSTANHSFWVTVYFSSLRCSKYWNMGSSKEFSLFFSFFLFFFSPKSLRQQRRMHHGDTKFWTMKSKLCWFSFYATEFGTESSHRQHKTKRKQKTATMGKSLRNPSRSVPKNGRFREGKKIDFGKNKCIKRRRGNTHKKMKKQGTEFSAIYRNPSLTW